MSEPTELEARVAATLRAKAAQVRVDDAPFVPSAPFTGRCRLVGRGRHRVRLSVSAPPVSRRRTKRW